MIFPLDNRHFITDGKNHGFGLKSIRTAVEKYDGSVVFGVQQNWFELKILLPRVL